MLFAPSPYRNVEVKRWYKENGWLYLIANFEKLECDILQLRAVGGASGATELLKWDDVDGLVGYEDRQAGLQTLRIRVQMAGVDWDWIEIRTTHACPTRENPTRKIDKVFTRWTAA